MTPLIKIAEVNIQKYGVRGNSVSLPRIFMDDNNLTHGIPMNIYRTIIDGKDALILIPKSNDENSSVTQNKVA